MKSLKNLLDKKNISRSGGVDEKSVESVFFGALQKELPNIGRADIQSFKFKDKKIFSRTAHPAIASDIWRRRERLKNEINHKLGDETVEDIRVK
ncbi:MAG: hypothetical protein QMD77_02480 [Patescibacteria group bacterium]|nr:hypothetical protein [Patescibacteria group bacterium]